MNQHRSIEEWVNIAHRSDPCKEWATEMSMVFIETLPEIRLRKMDKKNKKNATMKASVTQPQKKTTNKQTKTWSGFPWQTSRISLTLELASWNATLLQTTHNGVLDIASRYTALHSTHTVSGEIVPSSWGSHWVASLRARLRRSASGGCPSSPGPSHRHWECFSEKTRHVNMMSSSFNQSSACDESHSDVMHVHVHLCMWKKQGKNHQSENIEKERKQWEIERSWKRFFLLGQLTQRVRERERAGIHSVHSMTKPLQLIVTALLGIPQICREADLLAHRESLHRFTIRLSIRVTIHQHLQAEATKTSKVSNTHVFVKKSKKCACTCTRGLRLVYIVYYRTSNIKLLAISLAQYINLANFFCHSQLIFEVAEVFPKGCEKNDRWIFVYSTKEDV